MLPRLGRRLLPSITTDDVAALIADMLRDGYSGATIKGVLSPVRGMLGTAVRRGLIAANPVAGLEREERPRGGRREQRILERGEIGQLLAKAEGEYRTLIAAAVFTGLRQGELLGLRWAT